MIVIDTCIMLWFLRRAADTDGRRMHDRSRHLLQTCQDGRIPIGVPMPVLVETMSGMTLPEHSDFLTDAVEAFTLLDLDLEASKVAGRLELRCRDVRRLGGFIDERQAVKVDVLIAAIAIARGATKLYTDNVADFQAMTTGETIEICELPELPAAGSSITPPTRRLD